MWRSVGDDRDANAQLQNDAKYHQLVSKQRGVQIKATPEASKDKPRANKIHLEDTSQQAPGK